LAYMSVFTGILPHFSAFGAASRAPSGALSSPEEGPDGTWLTLAWSGMHLRTNCRPSREQCGTLRTAPVRLSCGHQHGAPSMSEYVGRCKFLVLISFICRSAGYTCITSLSDDFVLVFKPFERRKSRANSSSV
jgi:hypothetical protein